MTTYAQQAGKDNNNNNSASTSHEFSKKEEYRRYLDKTGVLDALTKVLVGLYEEPERPQSQPNSNNNNAAMDYIKRYLGAPANVDVEGLKRENEQLKQEVESLQRQLSQLRGGNATAASAVTGSPNMMSNLKGPSNVYSGTPNRNNS